MGGNSSSKPDEKKSKAKEDADKDSSKQSPKKELKLWKRLFGGRRRHGQPPSSPVLDSASPGARASSGSPGARTATGSPGARASSALREARTLSASRELLGSRGATGSSSTEAVGGARPRLPLERTIIEHPKRAVLLVAALDIGSAYSGYAYSFTDKPSAIFGSTDHVQKNPTVLLLRPDQTTDCFGDEAVKKYYEELSERERRRWYLFERFKMQLYSKDNQLLDRDMKLKDFSGKELPAIDVFAKTIAYLKQHLVKILQSGEKKTTIQPQKDIHWVLTVPAIWDDLAKHFMREAARRADIPDEMLTLALEPEAASVWCLKEFGVNELPIGTKYTLLDLGGGTADITVHERMIGGALKELIPPRGGAFGGNNINKNLQNLLTKLLGNNVIQKLKESQASVYRDLVDQFEVKKRYFDGSKTIRITLPLEVRELFQETVGESLEKSLENLGMPEGDISLVRDKLDLSKDLIREIFEDVVEGITGKLQEIEDEVETEHIILAGGFSCSEYIQKVITTHFGNKLKIPKDPDLVVLKGAVMYGHNPRNISSRKCKYTYGIARLMKFKDFHKPEKKVTYGGVDYVDDLFYKHIEIGQEVAIADAENTKAHEYFPPDVNARHVLLEVFVSDQKNPMYVDDVGCHRVGFIKLDIDPRGNIHSKILVKMIFGGTELVIEATDETNNTVVRQSIDFLG